MLVLLNPDCLIVDVHKMGPNGEVAKGFVRTGAWWYSEENFMEYCYSDERCQHLVGFQPAMRNQICIIPSADYYMDDNEIVHKYAKYKMDRMRVYERFLLLATHERPKGRNRLSEENYEDDDIPF